LSDTIIISKKPRILDERVLPTPAKMGTMEKWKDVKVIEEEKRKYKKWTDASSGGNIFFNTFFTLEIVITTYTLFSGISSS